MTKQTVRKGEEKPGGWPERWDLLLRYRLIEVVAQWEGRLTTGHLSRAFGIGRQQASKDINVYNAEKNPGALEYDKSLKGYKPTPAFQPRYTKGEAGEYLQLLSVQSELSDSIANLEIRLPNTFVISPPARAVTPVILQRLLRACRERTRLSVVYASISSPEPVSRVIQPHTLVYNGYRWHVRAWCEKHREFRDFVLSRMFGEPELLSPSTHSAEGDSRWQTEVVLEITADTRLSKAQQLVVELDWGMKEGVLRITTRAALAPYCLQLLRLDHKVLKERPEDQQVVLNNRDFLEPMQF